MAELTTLARPYAKAAFQVALQESSMEEWSKMLAVSAAITNEEGIKLLLQAPALTSDQVAQSFIDVCGDELTGKGQNFIRLLAENKRIALLGEVSKLFENLRAQQEQSLDVEVVTPYEIGADVSNKLVDALKSRLQKEVRLSTRTDQSLIGGAVIRTGDMVIDSSVRGKLAKLAESINT